MKNVEKRMADYVAQMDYIFGKKFRYVITDDLKLEYVEFDKAYQLLGVKEELLQSEFSFFSLHGHPSYLSFAQLGMHLNLG